MAGNVVRLLGQALLGHRCRTFTSDLRIRVTETGRPGQMVELESLHGIELPVDDVYLDPLAL